MTTEVDWRVKDDKIMTRRTRFTADLSSLQGRGMTIWDSYTKSGQFKKQMSLALNNLTQTLTEQLCEVISCPLGWR